MQFTQRLVAGLCTRTCFRTSASITLPTTAMLPRRGLLLVALAAIFLVRSSSSQDASSGDSVAPETDHYELNFIFLSSNNPRLRTSGSIPAVDIALEMVAASGILGKYTLTYSVALDSQVYIYRSLYCAVRIRRVLVLDRTFYLLTILSRCTASVYLPARII